MALRLPSLLTVSLLVLVTLTGVRAAVDADLVTSLPGLSVAFPAPEYSGFFPANAEKTKFLHYWLALSENKPATDPVVLWLNGGPGCSSLEGMLYENGPLHFADGSRAKTVHHRKSGAAAVPSLAINPNRWTKAATVIYLESPAGVGFSYATTQEGYSTSDNQTAADAFYFLTQFFAAYPEFVKNPFYISGESYAGIYIPMLAEQVVLHPSANINLQGVLVGNGCTGNAVGICGDDQNAYQTTANFFHGHGLASDASYAQVQKACNFSKPITNQCEEAVYDLEEQSGNLNPYDVLDQCYGARVNSGVKHHVSFRVPKMKPSYRKAKGLKETPPCVNADDGYTYLNDASVQKALHVDVAQAEWDICADINYDENLPSVLPIYNELLAKNVRVLIFNGDADSVVPHTDNEYWTTHLGVPIVEDFHAWYLNDQVAGYAINFQHNFTYITIKGAGHMVPQYKPAEAAEFFTRFLNGQSF